MIYPCFADDVATNLIFGHKVKRIEGGGVRFNMGLAVARVIVVSNDDELINDQLVHLFQF